MVLYINRDRAAGQAFSATADEAYIIAKDWKSFFSRVADSRGIIASETLFMQADEVGALTIAPFPAA